MRSLSNCTLTHYCLGDKIEKNEMGGARIMCGERRGVYRVLVGKLEGKRPLGRPRYRWKIILSSSVSGMCGYGLELSGPG